MKTIIIGGSPDLENDGIEITNPSQSLTKIDKCYIDYSKFGKKNTELFLKNYFKTVKIYSKRTVPPSVKKLCHQVIDERPKKLNLFQTCNLVTRKMPIRRKIKKVKETGIAPRIILKYLISNTTNLNVIDKLVMIDRNGEPTVEALCVVYEE